MSNLIDLTDDIFEAEVLKSDVPVLVDFYADWCGPCKRQGPICDELATELAGRAKVAKMNVDKAMEVAGKYGIMSIPTLIIFRKGEVGEKFVGLTAKDKLLKAIEKEIAEA